MPNYVTNRVFISADENQMNDILNAIRRDGDVLGSFDFNKLIPMPKELDITDGTVTDHAINAFLSHMAANAKENPNLPGRVEEIKRYVDAANQIMKQTFFHNRPQYLSVAEISALAERYDMSTSRFLNLGKQYLDNQIQYGAHTWYGWATKNWGTKWNVHHGSVLNGGNELKFDTAWSSPEPIMKALSEKFPKVRFDHKWADEDIGQNVGQCSYLAGQIIESYFPDPGSEEAYDLAFDVLETDAEEHCLRYDEKTGTYEYDEEMEEEMYSSLDGLIKSAENVRIEQLAAKVPAMPEHMKNNQENQR